MLAPQKRPTEPKPNKSGLCSDPMGGSIEFRRMGCNQGPRAKLEKSISPTMPK